MACVDSSNQSQPQPSQLLAVAVRHHRAGDLAAAEALYRRILRDTPAHIDSLHLLGLVANQRGEHAIAIQLIGQAIALKPDFADFRTNLAAALKAAGRLEDAQAECRQAISLTPSAKAYYALGTILQLQGRLSEALDAYRLTLTLNPNHAEAHSNLGTALQASGRIDEAAREYEWAVAARPNSPPAHYNLGLIRQEQSRPRDAIASYQQAIALNPDYADAHWNEALQHLALGEYDSGWTQYEWRWRRQDYPVQRFAERSWDGGNLTGRTILLSAEQGFGDTFQFIRYAALVKRLAGTVIVECQPALKQALAYTAGIDRLVGQGDPLPAFDRHAAMLSLPRLLGTDLQTIPADTPYIRPDPLRVAVWRGRVKRGSGRNVGLVWRGNPDNSDDRKRSMDAGTVARLCGLSGVNWFSLQIDATPEEIELLSRNGQLRDYGPALSDWADTAALIAMLDLVVTVDTAVAHLAGAMGRPVWVMLSAIPHWSWLRDRSDSPWYPTARLFRQKILGDWQGVIDEVELAARSF
ncbi:MAG: glycosyl transferase family 9 [Rhodospirillales bacterium]|nr:glycosyl transferase family 9 [Rhodospirillales bacterium]